MHLTRYILKRTLLSIPTLFGIILITFILFHMSGVDPASLKAGKYATAEQINLIKIQMHLDKSWPEQLLIYLKNLCSFDFGRSWNATAEPVRDIIQTRLAPSLLLMVPAFIFSFLISLTGATFSVFFKLNNKKNFIHLICLALMSISFLVFIIFIQYIFAYKIALFPPNGFSTESNEIFYYLALPWIIATIVSIGPNLLIYESCLLEEAQQDYVRTAQSKGLNSFFVFAKHILKNAALPIVTLSFLQIPHLIMGSLLLESFFAIPGLGGRLVQALNETDLPVVEGLTILGAVAYMFFNLASDILYSVLDPRIKIK